MGSMAVGKTSVLDCKISNFCQNSQGTKNNMKLNLSSTEQRNLLVYVTETHRLGWSRDDESARVVNATIISNCQTLHFCPIPIMNDGILSYVSNCRFMSN